MSDLRDAATEAIQSRIDAALALHSQHACHICAQYCSQECYDRRAERGQS